MMELLKTSKHGENHETVKKTMKSDEQSIISLHVGDHLHSCTERVTSGANSQDQPKNGVP